MRRLQGVSHSLPAYGRLRAQTPSGGSGPLRRASAPFAAKAAQGCRRQTPAAARGYALYGRSGLRPSLVQGLRPRNAPVQNQSRRGASVCVIPPNTPRQPITRRDPSITPITQVPPPRREHQLSVAASDLAALTDHSPLTTIHCCSPSSPPRAPPPAYSPRWRVQSPRYQMPCRDPRRCGL